MAKILHFFAENVFFEKYLQFLSRNFDVSDHDFVIWGDHKKYTFDRHLREKFSIFYSELNYKNIVDVVRTMNLCNKYDSIIFHSLFLPVPVQLFLVVNPNILKKSTWVIWGADVYCYRDKKTMYEFFYEYLRKINIKRFNSIATWFRCDYKLAQEWYHATGEYKEGWYTSPDYIINKNESRADDTINIILGNSATRTNRHIEALELLSKFKNEKISLFIPLSYGDPDPEYREQVIKKARELFGDKVTPMTEFMSMDKYREFMSSIDIGIFNNNRQQALANIFLLFNSGGKVYVNDDSTLWTGLVEEHLFKVYSINDIPGISFEQFIETDDKSVTINKTNAKRILSDEYQKPLWGNIFSLQTKSN
jgi:hypothetical protein